MNSETKERTPDQIFQSMYSARPLKHAEVLVFKLGESSYYPAWEEQYTDDQARKEAWWKDLKRRNITTMRPLDQAVLDGELYVFKFLPVGKNDESLFLAQLYLRSIYVKPPVVKYNNEKGKPVPEIDISLVSRRALAPHFQQVRGMSTATGLAKVYTIDDDGSHWSHHLDGNWQDFPLVKTE